MNDKIIYDFNLSKMVCNSLEEVIQDLHRVIIDSEKDNLELAARAWSSDSATVFAKKYSELIADVCRLKNELTDETERIKSMSRKMYILETEAKKIAAEKGN